MHSLTSLCAKRKWDLPRLLKIQREKDKNDVLGYMLSDQLHPVKTYAFSIDALKFPMTAKLRKKKVNSVIDV